MVSAGEIRMTKPETRIKSETRNPNVEDPGAPVDETNAAACTVRLSAAVD
jgi:hypothetical protein